MASSKALLSGVSLQDVCDASEKLQHFLIIRVSGFLLYGGRKFTRCDWRVLCVIERVNQHDLNYRYQNIFMLSFTI